MSCFPGNTTLGASESLSDLRKPEEEGWIANPWEILKEQSVVVPISLVTLDDLKIHPATKSVFAVMRDWLSLTSLTK